MNVAKIVESMEDMTPNQVAHIAGAALNIFMERLGNGCKFSDLTMAFDTELSSTNSGELKAQLDDWVNL